MQQKHMAKIIETTVAVKRRRSRSKGGRIRSVSSDHGVTRSSCAILEPIFQNSLPANASLVIAAKWVTTLGNT